MMNSKFGSLIESSIVSPKTLLRFASALVLPLSTVMLVSSLAMASPPLRDPSKLWEPRQETVLKLKNARVVVADYPLIRQDFPEVAKMTDAQIDKWLVDSTGYMSIQQVAQQETNTAIPVTGETTLAYRPREYGRAHVFKAGHGLIDVKGSGGIDPHAGFERTGLATLGEMIREYMMEKLVSKAFKHMGKYETVPCYAVLDLGFWAKGSGTNDQDVAAGAVLRRAHVRHHVGAIGDRQREDPVVLPRELQYEIEMALRHYGITSTIYLGPGQYKNTLLGDQLNIQGDENGAVIDFAGFRVRDHFELPVYYSYDEGGNAAVSDKDIAKRPNEPGFVQPDPALRVTMRRWGRVPNPMQDKTIMGSERLAHALEKGKAGRADVLKYYHYLMDPVDEKLVATPVRCSALFGG